MVTERVRDHDVAEARESLPRWRRDAEVADIVSLGDAMRRFNTEGTPVVLLWEESSGPTIEVALADVFGRGREPPDAIALVVGPVAGMTEREVRDAERCGAVVASLGDAVLRSYTAAVAAMVRAQSELRRRATVGG